LPVVRRRAQEAPVDGPGAVATRRGAFEETDEALAVAPPTGLDLRELDHAGR